MMTMMMLVLLTMPMSDDDDADANIDDDGEDGFDGMMIRCSDALHHGEMMILAPAAKFVGSRFG